MARGRGRSLPRAASTNWRRAYWSQGSPGAREAASTSSCTPGDTEAHGRQGSQHDRNWLQIRARSLTLCLGLEEALDPSPTPDRKTEAQRGTGIYPKSHNVLVAGTRPEPGCLDSWSGGFSAPALGPALSPSLALPEASGWKPFACRVSWHQALSPPGLTQLGIHGRGHTTSPGRTRGGGLGVPLSRHFPAGQRCHAVPGPSRHCPPGAPGLCP